jgi:hypothetical protein
MKTLKLCGPLRHDSYRNLSVLCVYLFTLHPKGEQVGFSAFTPWGRGKKAEKPGWILICQSRIRINLLLN